MDRIRAALVGVLVVVSLTSCTTPEQRQARFREQCLSFGAKEGTDEFVRCMTTLTAADGQRRATIAAGILAKPNARKSD